MQPFRLPFVSSMRLAFGQFQRCSCPEKSANETRSDSAANWSLSVFPSMPCKSDAACRPPGNMARMICVFYFSDMAAARKQRFPLQSGTLSELHLPASWLIEVPFLFFVVKFHKLCSYMKHLMNVGYFHDMHFSHL